MVEILSLCCPLEGESGYQYAARCAAMAELFDDGGQFVVVCRAHGAALAPDSTWATRAELADRAERWIARVAPQVVRQASFCSRGDDARHPLANWISFSAMSDACQHAFAPTESGYAQIYVLKEAPYGGLVGLKPRPILRNRGQADLSQGIAVDDSLLCLLVCGGAAPVVTLEWVRDPHMLQHVLNRLGQTDLLPALPAGSGSTWSQVMPVYSREFHWEIIDEQWAAIESMTCAQVRVAEVLLASEEWVSDSDMSRWFRVEMGLSDRQIDALIGVRSLVGSGSSRFDLRRRESLSSSVLKSRRSHDYARG